MKDYAVNRTGGWPVWVIGLCACFFSLGAQGDESLGTEDAKDMAFMSLTEEQRASVSAYLGHLLEESISRAEKKIRDEGSFVPFAYIGDRQGEGRFLQLPEDERVSAEVAAHGVQKAIVKTALDGDLIASIFYMTAEGPEQLGAMRDKVEDGLEEGQDIQEVRFLMVELQHIAGLSLVHVVPYWRSEGEWVFGEPVQRQVDPRLHQLVRNTIETYQNQQR